MQDQEEDGCGSGEYDRLLLVCCVLQPWWRDTRRVPGSVNAVIEHARCLWRLLAVAIGLGQHLFWPEKHVFWERTSSA